MSDSESRTVLVTNATQYAVPAGRLGTPEEVGELIAFFASGRSPFVTGQVVYFTGGWP